MPSAVAALVIATFAASSPAGGTIERLATAGYERPAAIIRARIAQTRPKMKLSPAQGRRAARALAVELERSAAFRRLVAVMPRSAIELARAIVERDLDAADARAIADYLTQLVAALELGNLEQFDENHSHVTGRRWREIDYSGERMTWQGQKRYWAPRGVADFRSVSHVDAYMRVAATMRYFKRIYRPRRSIRDFRYRPTPPRRAPRSSR